MSDKAAVTVVGPDQKEYTVWGLAGQTVMEILLLHTIDNDNYCGGHGTCGRCKLKVEGAVSEITAIERQMLLAEELKEDFRLTCKTVVQGRAKVFLAEHNSYLPRFDTESMRTKNNEAAIRIHSFFIPGLDKDRPVAIYRRIKDALKDYNLDISIDNINQLLMMDRAGRPALQLYGVIFDNNIVKYISREAEEVFGIALDLGSTTLFAALVNLLDGQVIAVASKTNMQRIYGADIISRLSYAVKNEDGPKKLHQILINNINSMIEDLINQASIMPWQIFNITVAANPVMLHFFADISIKGFIDFPYMGAFVDELQFGAKEIGIIANDDAQIYLLPQVGGFVGADTIAALLNLEEKKSACYLLVDIGTNGEIVLHKKGRMWAASAAAGPAFEGGHISCGVRAGQGSIDKVWLGEDNGLEFSIIGKKPVRGLCGSAIIDLSACLLKAGYIDNNGIINISPEQNLTIINENLEAGLIIYDQGDILPGKPIIFIQEDIRQVQLAKSAFRTTIDLLLEKADLSYEDLDYIFLAGAFGNYLNPMNSIAIGLLPPVEPVKVINLGNAAANGAISALLSPDKRIYAAELAQKIEYVELANNENFQKYFLNNLNFFSGNKIL